MNWRTILFGHYIYLFLFWCYFGKIFLFKKCQTLYCLLHAASCNQSGDQIAMSFQKIKERFMQKPVHFIPSKWHHSADALRFRGSWIDNLGENRVDGNPSVIEGRGSHDDTGRPDEAGSREKPKKEPIEHHRDELPIFNDLQRYTESALE